MSEISQIESGSCLSELLDRDVIDPCRTLLRRNLLKRCPQISLGEDFVKQPEPFVSFHSLFKSRQHANGPSARFDPSPSRENLVFGSGRSGLLSRRHYHRFVFRSFGHSTSIFLQPFAPPALPGFLATMAVLTPAR